MSIEEQDSFDWKNFKNKDEVKIAQLINNFGLKPCTNNIEIIDDNGNIIGEIDIIFEYNEFILFFEVTAKKDGIKKDADHWFSRWTDQKNIKYVREQAKIPNYKVIRVFVDLAHVRGSIRLASINHILQKEENNYLFRDDIDYFSESYQNIGKITRNDFFNFIKLPRSNISKPIDAIKFFIDGVPAYSFICKVEDLLETCYIKRRYGKDDGYQRALDYSRIKSISNDILNEKILAFPNSILVNSENKFSLDKKNEDECPCPLKIQLPISYCEFKVVDGQHRLLGFSNLSEIKIKNSYLPVIAFEKMPSKKELKMFIDINSKQKKVDSNLVYLLKTEFNWDPTEKEYYEKIAVLVALELDKNSPLAGKIYFGTAKEKKKDKPIKLSTLVSILKNNGYVRKNNPIWQNQNSDIKTPIKKTKEVISSINRYLKYEKNGGIFFLQNIGLRIIFRLIKIIEYNRHVKRISVTNSDVIKDLSSILNKDNINELESSYGEGGANNSANILCQKLMEGHGIKYKNLELNLIKIKFIKKV